MIRNQQCAAIVAGLSLAVLTFGISPLSAGIVSIANAQSAGSGSGAAQLSLSPAGGAEAVGSTFTVSVMLNSGGGVGVNAADGELSFDPTTLSVQSVSKGNSIFNLWT